MSPKPTLCTPHRYPQVADAKTIRKDDPTVLCLWEEGSLTELNGDRKDFRAQTTFSSLRESQEERPRGADLGTHYCQTKEAILTSWTVGRGGSQGAAGRGLHFARKASRRRWHRALTDVWLGWRDGSENALPTTRGLLSWPLWVKLLAVFAE